MCNIIFSQLGLNALRIIVLTYYLLIKFLTMCEIEEVCGNQTLVRQCYVVSYQVKPSNTFAVEGLDTRDELAKEKGKPIEDVITILLHDGNPQHMVQISSRLNKITKQQLMSFI